MNQMENFFNHLLISLKFYISALTEKMVRVLRSIYEDCQRITGHTFVIKSKTRAEEHGDLT